MRGGAIPLVAWGAGLLVLYAINWVWEGRTIQVGTTVFAIVVIYLGAFVLWLLYRAALRPGPPPAEARAEALPTASLASMVAGLSLGMILFGLVWSPFLTYFGLALLLVSLARLALELRAERELRRRLGEEGRGPREEVRP